MGKLLISVLINWHAIQQLSSSNGMPSFPGTGWIEQFQPPCKTQCGLLNCILRHLLCSQIEGMHTNPNALAEQLNITSNSKQLYISRGVISFLLSTWEEDLLTQNHSGRVHLDQAMVCLIQHSVSYSSQLEIKIREDTHCCAQTPVICLLTMQAS